MSEREQTTTIGPELAAAEAVAMDASGVVDGRFELRARLGRGGNAVVYRAFDRLLRSEVALKLLRQENEPQKALARIRREMAVVREVGSPRLVRVFEAGQAPEGLYLTMEIMSGGSLRDRLAGEPRLPIPEVVRIAVEVLEGLEALHQKGVVHRDITPGNILFTSEGDSKLGDFGLVRRRDREESLVTAQGTIVGTVGYLSPEQARGEEVGPLGDLYSLGVVLFRSLAGRLPKEVTSEFSARLAPFYPAASVRLFRPETPTWLARVVARLLEKRPADRYGTAAEVLHDLRAHHSSSSPRLRRAFLRLAVLAVLCLPPFGVLVTQVPRPRFSHLVPAGQTGVKAVSAAGETLWTIPDVSPDVADRFAFARITPGGKPLLAAVLLRPRRWMPEDVNILSFVDPDTGKVVRRVALPSGANTFPNDPPRFNVSSTKAVDLFDDGVDEVVVNYSHVPEAPYYAVLYAPRYDQARIVFYSRGGQDFQGAADLDGDGVKELLFAGINNGWNWVNAVAAVRFDPESLKIASRIPIPAAPDVMVEPQQERMLLWYAVVPRGHFDDLSRLTVDEKSRRLTLHYLSGKTWNLGFGGFVFGEPSGTDRQDARRAAFEHLRESDRLRQAGAFDLAIVEAEAARAAAERAREVWLGQYADRLRAKVLASEGRIPEAEALFASLADRAEDAPEVAYDAAVAFHLHGELSRAVAWYERGIGRGSAIGAGKSKHEFLKGEVLALVEAKHYREALSAVERFGATYPPFQDQLWLFREYVRWRSGERPTAAPLEVPPNWTDLDRYWDLEFRFARGGDPKEILGRVDRFLAEHPETRAEALSLRAEVLAKLGRLQEASENVQAALTGADSEKARSIVARGHRDLIATRVARIRLEIRQTPSDSPTLH